MWLDIQEKEILIFAAGVIVTLAVGYWFYRKGLHKRKLSYSVARQRLIYLTRDYPGALKISFDGRDIKSFIRLTLYVWNSGNQAIVGSDLATKSPLRVELDSHLALLQHSILYQTREANNVAICDNKITFDYLNPRDGFVIDLFVEERGTKLPTKAKGIQLVGDIIGLAYPPKVQDFELGSMPLIGVIVGIVSVFFWWILGNGVLNLWAADWSNASLKTALIYSFAMLVGLTLTTTLTVAALASLMTERIPIAIISQGEHRGLRGYLKRHLKL